MPEAPAVEGKEEQQGAKFALVDTLPTRQLLLPTSYSTATKLNLNVL